MRQLQTDLTDVRWWGLVKVCVCLPLVFITLSACHLAKAKLANWNKFGLLTQKQQCKVVGTELEVERHFTGMLYGAEEGCGSSKWGGGGGPSCLLILLTNRLEMWAMVGLLTCVCWCCIAVTTVCPLLVGWSAAQTPPPLTSTFIVQVFFLISCYVMIDICSWFGRWSLNEQPCCQTTGARSRTHGNTSLWWQSKQSWWLLQREWKLYLIWFQVFRL